MAWVAVDHNGEEWVYNTKPYRHNDYFWLTRSGDGVPLPKGSIKKLIGRNLTWKGNPVELKEK